MKTKPPIYVIIKGRLTPLKLVGGKRIVKEGEGK